MRSDAKYGRRRLGLFMVVGAVFAACAVDAGTQVWAAPFALGDLLLFGAGMGLMCK